MNSVGLIALLALAACGPVSRENAEFQCREQAHLAERPRGNVAIGAGTGGVRSRVALEIGSDFILGRDPASVYDQCAMRRTGQLPKRRYDDFAG